jgi:hypothetical protein
MAEPITVNCPECDKKMKVPADARGKKVRCRACEHVFVVPGAKAAARPGSDKVKPAKPPAPAPKPAPAADDEGENEDGDGKPYGVTTLDLTPRCPDCANEMGEGDVICLHCGYNTMTRTYHRTRKVRDVTGNDIFLWLLPGILSIIAILLLIGMDIWYCLCIRALVVDEWYEFIGHGACMLWLVILSLFGMFYAGKFAVKRLILDNKPPEIEEN